MESFDSPIEKRQNIPKRFKYGLWFFGLKSELFHLKNALILHITFFEHLKDLWFRHRIFGFGLDQGHLVFCSNENGSVVEVMKTFPQFPKQQKKSQFSRSPLKYCADSYRNTKTNCECSLTRVATSMWIHWRLFCTKSFYFVDSYALLKYVYWMLDGRVLQPAKPKNEGRLLGQHDRF